MFDLIDPTYNLYLNWCLIGTCVCLIINLYMSLFKMNVVNMEDELKKEAHIQELINTMKVRQDRMVQELKDMVQLEHFISLDRENGLHKEVISLRKDVEEVREEIKNLHRKNTVLESLM